MDLVALKTRPLKKEVPIRRDESECVMTAVSRSCFALALLFQKSACEKRESKKEFFFRFSFFPSFAPFFDQNAKTTERSKEGPFDQKRSQKVTLVIFDFFF